MIPEITIERARRLYTGVDPDTRQSLTEADCARMGGAAIAAAVGVHPHTVDAWIKRFCWRRPPWYHKRAGRKAVKPGAVAKALESRIENAASTGAALPDNFRLAREIGCSVQGVMAALRRLRQAGTLSSERNGPFRRLVLRDGCATGWSRLTPVYSATGYAVLGEAPDDALPVDARARRSPVLERALDAIERWATAGEAMPGDPAGGKAIGCSPSAFRRALKKLRESGRVTVEHRPHRRRFILPDGRATGWSVPQLRMKPLDAARVRALPPVRFTAAPLDLAVEEAVRSLRRQGPVVYDLAVVTGCAPGVAWSVDGRTMNRGQLLAEAARRNARAIERLAGDLGVPA